MIFIGMEYKLNGVNIFGATFVRMRVTMNWVDVARFFEAIYRGILEHLLATGFKDWGFFSYISTDFGKVETNGQRMLHLYY